MPRPTKSNSYPNVGSGTGQSKHQTAKLVLDIPEIPKQACIVCAGMPREAKK